MAYVRAWRTRRDVATGECVRGDELEEVGLVDEMGRLVPYPERCPVCGGPAREEECVVRPDGTIVESRWVCPRGRRWLLLVPRK